MRVKIQNYNKMGMYTELIFGARLKTDTPKEVICTLRYMVGDIEKPEILAFDSNKNPLIGGSSYFGVISGATKMYYKDTAKCWVLSSRANIKNCDRYIESFLEWIKPFVDSGSGNRNMYAITIREDQSKPTVYYL